MQSFPYAVGPQVPLPTVPPPMTHPAGPVARRWPWRGLGGGRKCDLADPLVGVVGNIHRTAAAAGKRGDGHCVWWWAWGGHTHKPLGHKHTQKRTAQEQPVVLRLFLHL